MRVNGVLGQLPAEQRTYWLRFATLLWGRDYDFWRASGQQQSIEETLANEADRYRRLGHLVDFTGWFQNRPEEYAAYIAEYGGIPVNHGVVSDRMYDPTKSDGYVMMHIHAAEQGAPLNSAWAPVIAQQQQVAAVAAQAPSMFSIGHSTPAAVVNTPGAPVTVGPVTPDTSGAIYYPPNTQPPPSAGGGSSGPAVVPFPDVGAGGYPGGSGDAGSGGAAAAPSALAPIAIAVILALAMGG